MILLQLLASFLVIGLGAFGGGMATLPLLYEELVINRQWLLPAELNQIIAVSEMTPGPIAINAATFSGFQVAGAAGSAVATIAVMLPSLSLLTLFYFMVYRHTHSNANPRIERIASSLRPGISAMIAYAVWTIGSSAIFDIATATITITVFLILTFARKIHPILLLTVAGLVGMMLYWDGVWGPLTLPSQ